MFDNCFSDISPPTLSCSLLTLNNLTLWFRIQELHEDRINWMWTLPPAPHTHTPQLIAKDDPVTSIHIFDLIRNLHGPHFCCGLRDNKANSVKHTEHIPWAPGKLEKMMKTSSLP